LLTTVKIVGFSVNFERTFGTMKEGGRKQGAPSPCAACKLLRRRCAQDCVFAPYFPADEPQKFANVHKVFGASNVNKMLQVGSCLTLLFNLYSTCKVYLAENELKGVFGSNILVTENDFITLRLKHLKPNS